MFIITGVITNCCCETTARDAFVGDLDMNKFPLRLTPGLPIFAEDRFKLIESWQKLLDLEVKTIYPAHGKTFSADIIRDKLNKY